MDNYSIKEIEAISGIKAHTIRIWEQRYNFLKPCRTPTNIRYYSCEELKKLINVSFLNKYGYKISQLDCMCSDEMEEKIMLLDSDDAIHERIITRLLHEMVDQNPEKFEKILDDQITKYGIDRAIIEIIYPFLEKTGIVWQSCCLGLAQQHIVSPIIRQKLIVAIDSQVAQKISDKSFLLFLPEGEHLELGILFMYYLLKRKGIPVIYLGANVPVNDVAYVTQIKKPAIVIAHITSKFSNPDLQKLINNLKKNLLGTEVVISMPNASVYRKKLPANFCIKSALSEVLEQFTLL